MNTLSNCGWDRDRGPVHQGYSPAASLACKSRQCGQMDHYSGQAVFQH
jgi:hypothetical protein